MEGCPRHPVVEKRVVHPAVSVWVIVGIGSPPNDFVFEVFNAENLIQDCLRIVHDMPVKMHVQAPGIRHELAQENCRLVKPLEVAIESSPPRVSISLLLNYAGLLCEPFSVN